MQPVSNDSKHPSGLTWAEWEWPFKTLEQRDKVIQFHNPNRIDNLGTDNPF